MRTRYMTKLGNSTRQRIFSYCYKGFRIFYMWIPYDWIMYIHVLLHAIISYAANHSINLDSHQQMPKSVPGRVMETPPVLLHTFDLRLQLYARNNILMANDLSDISDSMAWSQSSDAPILQDRVQVPLQSFS